MINAQQTDKAAGALAKQKRQLPDFRIGISCAFI